MAPHPTMLMSSVPAQATVLRQRQQRNRDAGALLAIAAMGLVVVAAVLVTVHPMEVELKSDSASQLFENALKSQQADRAKHKAAEQKLKSQVESSIAKEPGTPRCSRKQSVAAVTLSEPSEMSFAERPALLWQPPIEPTGALLLHGQFVQPI